MSSPFPGMDPYLEDPAIWPDFHGRFINCWSEAIAEFLPEGYDVRIGERVYLSEPGEDRRRIIPDASIGDTANPPVRRRDTNPAKSGLAVTLEPTILPLVELDPLTERFIQVSTLPDRRIVAVLEFLSPSNKSGRGRVEYLDKRDEIIKANIHLVELDLLVGGHRLPMKRPLPPGDYFALVARAEKRPNCEVYSWRLEDRLPSIPIPLRDPDADVVVDLPSIFSCAYERGRYPRILKYDREPVIDLGGQRQAWAREIAGSQVRI